MSAKQVAHSAPERSGPGLGRKILRRLTILGLFGGMALAAWIIVHVGGPAIAADLQSVGWKGLAAISGFHLIATTLMGIAWWRLQRVGKRWVYILGRLLRDAGSEVLPLSQIGGYMLATRIPIMRGVEPSAAAASVVVDATLEFCAQIAYIAIGIALLMWSTKTTALAGPMLVVVILATAAATVFIAFQTRHSKFPARAAARLSGRWAARTLAGASAVQAGIRQIYGSKGGVWKSFLLHLAAWIISGIEAWLILFLMGISRSPILVLAIESLVYASRSMAFIVPNAIGVQEAAYVVLSATLGLSPDAALGLSLLKRGRDIVLGTPVLLTWQVLEWRNRRKGRRPATGHVPG